MGCQNTSKFLCLALTPVPTSAVSTFPFSFDPAVYLQKNEWETAVMFVSMVVNLSARLAWKAVVICAVRFFLRNSGVRIFIGILVCIIFVGGIVTMI